MHQELLTGRDFVVMNQPAAALASNRELTDSLEAHWRRLISAGRAGHKDS